MSSDLKRPLDTDGAANGGGPGALVVKRQRTEDSQLALKGSQSTKDVRFEPALRVWELWVTYGVKRTSKLDAPTMLLTGHSGEVLSCKFSPDGASIASGSHDKSILLWKTYGECENYSALAGHQNAVVELHWTVDGEKLLSASADCTVRAWDAAVGIQVKKMKEHSAFVNTCCPLRRGSPPLLASGSDDGTMKVWDLRSKRSVQTLTGAFPVIAVAFSDSGTELYTAGIEDAIKVWDLRKEQVSMVMPGHSDTVTGLALHPDGTHLLSNAMDNTLRVWDMRPFAPANRCVKVLAGHQHSFDHNMLRCSWSPDGSRVSAGSSDRMVNVWEVSSRMLQYKLPGHNGCVNEVVFHPEEPIVASCSSDQQLYLGELAA